MSWEILSLEEKIIYCVLTKRNFTIDALFVRNDFITRIFSKFQYKKGQWIEKNTQYIQKEKFRMDLPCHDEKLVCRSAIAMIQTSCIIKKNFRTKTPINFNILALIKIKNLYNQIIQERNDNIQIEER